MTIERARNVGPAHLDLAYERLGDPARPPVLLIMGLNMQLIAWPDGFCDELIARGLRVIRFDNRDTGESTHMTSAPMPDFQAALAGDYSSVSYTLSDLAADSIGLLDVLGIESAHIVGASMGGYIAQTMAIENPARVRSLTSIMSTTGDPRVGQPHPEAMVIFTGGPVTTREQAVQRTVNAARVVGSPGFPPDVDAIAERAGRAFDRGHDELAIVRQGIAVLASGDRTARLRSLDLPALVIHGDSDRMTDISGGYATAAAIPGAKLVVYEGMGHDLPRPLWPQLADQIAETVRRGEARRT